MKRVISKSLLVIVLTILGSALIFSANAQKKNTSPVVYAVINKASWCPVCQANGERIMKEVMPACKDLKVKFIANDLTDNNTISNSTAELKKSKLYNSVKGTKSTGVIILVDAKTKKIVKQISVARPSEEIIKEITATQG